MGETKADYVRRQPQTRGHGCHWPGCTKEVPPAMWGCKPHWFKLPKRIRNMIWATYAPGQEEGHAQVSEGYFHAAEEAQRWIREHGKP